MKNPVFIVIILKIIIIYNIIYYNEFCIWGYIRNDTNVYFYK